MRAIQSDSLEEQLAYHAAPALMGMKPSGLIYLGQSSAQTLAQVADFNQYAQKAGMRIRILCNNRKQLLLFVYHKERLEIALNRQIRTLLRRQFGYERTDSLDVMLHRLAERVRSANQFPHEIGLFLGYPIEDVLGFIAHRGEDYLLLGYWKVYGDTERAKRLFSQYDRCRSYLCGQLEQGSSLYQALHLA